MEENWITQDWRHLENMLPEGWREQARPLGALRRGRKVRTPEELLRLVLMHVGPGLSLAQAVARAVQCGLPQISDVALMDRMRGAEGWLRWMCQKLLEQSFSRKHWDDLPGGLRVVAVDSTCIQEPGATGSDWRLHYAIEMPGLFCKQAQVSGTDEGESLSRYEVRKGDVLMGDRNYCKASQIRHVLKKGGHVLLRWHSTTLPLLDGKGEVFDVAAWARGIKRGECGQEDVKTKDGNVAMRVCVVRVSEKAAQEQRAAVRESARKNGRLASEESLALADYIVVVTTLPQKHFDARAVMELYRLRWQIELAFKRLKSLLGTGHVPKTDPDSSRAWLQAKLLTCLLIEKLLLEAEVFSPWGYLLPAQQPLG